MLRESHARALFYSALPSLGIPYDGSTQKDGDVWSYEHSGDFDWCVSVRANSEMFTLTLCFLEWETSCLIDLGIDVPLFDDLECDCARIEERVEALVVGLSFGGSDVAT